MAEPRRSESTTEMHARIRQWVVGFLIDPAAEHVLLVRKARPAWMAGKLNGVGGKVEAGETAAEAMRREAIEETGGDFDDWEPFVRLTAVTVENRTGAITSESGVIWFFRRFGKAADIERAVRADRAKPFSAGESLERHGIHDLGAPGPGRDCVVPNLLWLIPLARHQRDRYELIEVVETWTSLRETVPDGNRSLYELARDAAQAVASGGKELVVNREEHLLLHDANPGEWNALLREHLPPEAWAKSTLEVRVP